MNRKLIALLLALAMVLSMASTAFAADTDETAEPTETVETTAGSETTEPSGEIYLIARDTEFFEDRYHADVKFEDLELVLIDVDEVIAAAEKVRELCADADNLDEVKAGVEGVIDSYLTATTMRSLANIYFYMDVTTDENATNYSLAQEIAITVSDETAKLIRDVLKSPCAAVFDDWMPEEFREDYLAYEDMSDEMKALVATRTELENAYLQSNNQVYTAEFDGVVWDDNSVYAAYTTGAIDLDTYTEISRTIAKNKNAVQGGIYMELLDVWAQLAALEEYANYGELIYDQGYFRDYGQEELEPYYAAVKEYIVPLNGELELIFSAAPLDGAFFYDYTGDFGLDLLEPYIAKLSDEMLEAFDYMRDHNMWDNAQSATKGSAGFVTMLDAYGAPFFFDQPYADITSLFTVAHEFGHYNSAYWADQGWMGTDAMTVPMDTAEVHSQGLELLMLEFYPEIFGEDAAEDILVYNMYVMTDSIIQGALYDELQWYAHTTEDVTLEQINAKYCELAKAYRLVPADDERTEMYGWVDVPHSFSSPFYYISYSTSAAGALVFWLESQTDYFAAVDKYLEFVSLGRELYFRENFEAVGLESPISAEYIARLAETLSVEVGISDLIGEIYALIFGFSDVAPTDWFYTAVNNTAYYGLISPASSTFNPNDNLSWAETVTLAVRFNQLMSGESVYGADDQTEVWYEIYTDYALEYGIIDEVVDNPEDYITRDDAALIFAAVLGEYEPINEVEDGYFTDVASDSPAHDAIYALAEAGISNGKRAGEFGADDTILRCEAVTLVARMAGLSAPVQLVTESETAEDTAEVVDTTDGETAETVEDTTDSTPQE